MAATESVFKKNRTLILFLIGLVIVFGLLYTLRSAILPFLIGLVIVYLLLPPITRAEKKLPYKGRGLRAKRVFLILLTFVVVLALVGLFFFYTITAAADSFATLLSNAPEYISKGLSTAQDWFESFRQNLSLAQQQQVDEYISKIGTTLGTWVQNAFVSGLTFIPSTFSMILGFCALPIFLFYILKDSKKLGEGFYSFFSPGVALHIRSILSIMDNVLGRYIRAQLLLGLVVATLVFTGLTILGIKLAPALAIIAGVTELIPTVGPWIGGAVGVIVTLAVAPDKVLWVVVVYLSVQMLENMLLVPRIQGGLLRINPGILIFLLVLGSYLAGIWGMLLVAPLTATIVEIYKYVRQNISAEESQQLPQQ